jgi:predicted protein tyrosine phosphatase
MRIHVCPLSRLAETAAAIQPRHLVTLMNVATPVARPADIEASNHLVLGLSDIAEPLEGHVLPAEDHVAQLVDFARRWDRAAPLLIHCWAGVSRSTAAAYICACVLDPSRDEGDAALALRRASPMATPNPRLIAVADAMLGREGRMIAAIGAIGRGADCYEGTPFAFPER